MKKNDIAIVKSVEQRINEIMSRIKVFERDGELWTDSLSVAEVFGKTHDNLLKVIRKIDVENQLVGLVSFNESSYINSQGKEQPYFEMTETGFFALAARFNDLKDTDISLIRSCYFKEFDRVKKEKKTSFPELSALISGLVISVNKFCEGVNYKIGDLQTDQKQTTKVVGFIGEKVDRLETKVDGIEGKLDNIVKLTDRRRPVSKKDKAKHIAFTYSKYNGLCPCCGDVQIINEFRQPINGAFEIDHFYDKTRNQLEETWPICKRCNSQRANGGISHNNVEGRFIGYQSGLRMWEQKKHFQMQIGVVNA